MLCKSCKAKPVARGIKNIRCSLCRKETMVSCSYGANICNDCSDQNSKCAYCGISITKKNDEIIYTFDLNNEPITMTCENAWINPKWVAQNDRLRTRKTQVPLTLEDLEWMDGEPVWVCGNHFFTDPSERYLCVEVNPKLDRPVRLRSGRRHGTLAELWKVRQYFIRNQLVKSY